MVNLGRSIVLFLASAQLVFGAIEARVDSQNIEEGDVVTLVLSISGEKVKKPTIDMICGNEVLSTSSHSSMTISNGAYANTYTLSYQFAPQKDCEIVPIEVEVDGKIEKTKPIKITLKPLAPTQEGEFELRLESDKKELFVGEAFDVTLLFRQKLDTNPLDSSFEPPQFKGFWVKNESQPQRYQENGYAVTKVVYTVAPQREGKASVEPAKMKIATRIHKKDMFGAWMQNIKWKTYVSNSLEYDVATLPQGVSLVGDFTLDVHYDTATIHANEAMHITLSVKGEGNLEDIGSFKPFIENVSVFEEKILKESNQVTQKLTFVADEDFIIPSFSLTYFDLKTKKTKTIQTQPIAVKVKNAQASKEVVVQRKDEPSLSKASESQNSYLFGMLGFVFGFASALALRVLRPWYRAKKEKSTSLKDPKTALIKLLPHKEDPQVREIVEILEKNIYAQASLQIDKKVLKEIIKKYNLS